MMSSWLPCEMPDEMNSGETSKAARKYHVGDLTTSTYLD
jgi:hypothetical protein